MVNVGLGWSSFLGICLAAAGLALYFLRSLRPKLARDHDIFFAAVGLLCGGILFFQGWRQDPILQFGQFLLTASAVFFAVESIRLRGVTTEQAKRTTPIVDEERPVSRRYEAVLEEFPSIQERFNPRRIRGTKDGRSGREDVGREETGRDDYSRDDYGDGVRRRSSPRSASDDFVDPPASTRRRRPRAEDDAKDPRDYFGDDDDGSEGRGRGRSSSPARSTSDSSAATRSARRPRSTSDSARSRNRGSAIEDPASQYVDYRPINSNDDETDNWGDE